VRLNPLLHKLAYQKAIEKGITLNKFIENTLRKALIE
jgi:predicted HicB family RNase H-like nuclease